MRVEGMQLASSRCAFECDRRVNVWGVARGTNARWWKLGGDKALVSKSSPYYMIPLDHYVLCTILRCGRVIIWKTAAENDHLRELQSIQADV